jgi:RNA polymerase sigma-70 factor (ECF subfamily)
MDEAVGGASPYQGARAVFEILVRENADMLVTYLRSVLARGAPVDDLFQEVMVVAWRRLKDYDRTRPFGPWLRGIARMIIFEHARRERVVPATMDPEVLSAVDRRFDLIAATRGDTFGEKTDKLTACLEELPELMRGALDLIYGRSLTLQAAAAACSSSYDAMMKRVQRARGMLAECMGFTEPVP